MYMMYFAVNSSQRSSLVIGGDLVLGFERTKDLQFLEGTGRKNVCLSLCVLDQFHLSVFYV